MRYVATLALISLVLLGVGLILDDRKLSVPYDSTDSPEGRSGLYLRTDNLTGCQYLEGNRGGITPRLNTDGRHMGCR